MHEANCHKKKTTKGWQKTSLFLHRISFIHSRTSCDFIRSTIGSEVGGQVQLQNRDSISLWGRMPDNKGTWIKVVKLKDSFSALYADIHWAAATPAARKDMLKRRFSLVYTVIIYKNWTLLWKRRSFAKTSRHFDMRTTMVAGETVAFSLKGVYLFRPGSMPASILQQHCLSQESHYCPSQLEKVPRPEASWTPVNLLIFLMLFLQLSAKWDRTQEPLEGTLEACTSHSAKARLPLQCLYLHSPCGSGEDKHI